MLMWLADPDQPQHCRSRSRSQQSAAEMLRGGDVLLRCRYGEIDFWNFTSGTVGRCVGSILCGLDACLVHLDLHCSSQHTCACLLPNTQIMLWLQE